MEKTKKLDNRMQWIVVMEECRNSNDQKVNSTEYELCSEVMIPGVLEYGNGVLLCSCLQEKNKDGLYTYLVRVKHVEKEYKFDETNYSKTGYYVKNGLIGELIALFSVYFQARFYLKATVRGELTPTSAKLRCGTGFQYGKPHPFVNWEMFSDQGRNWGDEGGLKSFLDTIIKIDQQYHQNLIRAFQWYAEAIKEVGINQHLFFIKMVSAVEALLEFVPLAQDSLEQKLGNLLAEKKFTREEKGEIKNWLQNRKIRRKFVSFLGQYSKYFFTGGRRKATQCHIYRYELDDYAKRIYDARSAYLHNGKPMYISWDKLTDDAKYWDLSPGLEMMIDRKKFTAGEQLPRTRWFERLVNHCLKNFVKSLTSEI